MTDQVYKTFSYRFQNGGLSARHVYDKIPPGRYLNLDNLESREEGVLSSRYGLAAISTNGSTANYPLGTAVTSLGRMQGLASTYNYAQAGTGLYRKATDAVGQYTSISTALSGNRMSMYPYRPNNNSNPYMFFADDDVLLKDSGTNNGTATLTISTISYTADAPAATVTVASTAGMIQGEQVTIAGNSNGIFNTTFTVYQVLSSTQFGITYTNVVSESGTGGTASFLFYAAQNWGIAPPRQPPLIAPATPGLLDIELFDESTDSSFTLANLTGGTMLCRIQGALETAVTTPGVQFVELAGPSVVQIVRSSNVSTVTTSAAHGWATGMRVAITLTSDPTFSVASAVITVTGTSTFTYANAGANGTITNGSLSAAPSLQVGMSVTTTDVNAETVYITAVETIAGFAGFIANFTKTHAVNTTITSNYLSGAVAANGTATITKAGALNISFTNVQDQPDQNFIQLYVLASNPLAVAQISILFDVGDGTFTQDYYSAAIGQSPAQAPASGTTLYGYAQVQAVAARAAGGVNVSTLGGNDPSLLPADYPLLQQMQPSTLNPAGANPWSYIQVPLANFVANGAAGGPNNGWANVVAWRIQIQTQATLSTTVGFDDFAFVGGSDLNSFAGQAYDYRYTYLSINTGCESGPSQIMVATTPSSFVSYLNTVSAYLPIPLSVQNTAISIQPLQPTDPQVTHINIYRRGGSLTQAWYFVTQIPVGTATFLDTIADSIIEDNNVLTVDADAPVTSLLPQPLNTTLTVTSAGLATIGPGSTTGTVPAGVTVYPGQLVTVGASGTQEQAYVQTVAGTSVTLYLQLNHGSASHTVSTPFTATTRPQLPMNLMAIAFDKAWLAGDPNNPHFLYYSITYQPETFPVEQYLEIGTPDAPIMALIELSGLLFVFTTKRVYEILGAGSAVPTVIPTGVKHGMAAQFAWCVAEGVIYYLSYDGIYAFQGGQSTYMTEPVEWIWTGKNFGPVQAINTSQKSQVVMAYWNHEIYCRYVDQSGNSHRLISNETYGYRWRNDDQSAGNITAMYFAEDTGALYVGKDDGMVYQDRINDFDSGGWSGGNQIKNAINYTLQSAQMDQSETDPVNAKRNKLYNEFTLDFDSAGQNVSVSLLFNGGAGVTNGTTLALGTFSQTGRGQIQIPINAGQGQEALNVGVLLTGSATTAVTFYEVQFRAAPQAEFRQSWDSWWLGQGSSDWKMTKQIFAEYKSPNSTVTVNAFIDGNMTTPAFTFVLPITPGTHRASNMVRFPATKYKLIRFIGTPTAGIDPNQTNNFQMYDDTQFEMKSLTPGNGYQRSKISP
jgi:hypothetical protein